MFAAVSLSAMMHAQTAPFAKAQVADRIRKVEDGVDEFRKYLDNRGEDAQDRAQSAQNSRATTRRQSANSSNSEARRNQATQTKDDLEDAMERPGPFHKPFAEKVRSDVELFGGKGTNGAGNGQRASR
jgi:hypothetical protein